MSTTRTNRKQQNFSVIDNSGATNRKLSGLSRGILWYLLTKPNGWEIRNNDLMQEFSIKEQALDTAFRNLEDCGYLCRIKLRSKSGRFEWIREIFETPEECENWKKQNSNLIAKSLRKMPENCKTQSEKSNKNKTSKTSTIPGSTMPGSSGYIVNTDVGSYSGAKQTQSSTREKTEKKSISHVCQRKLTFGSDPDPDLSASLTFNGQKSKKEIRKENPEFSIQRSACADIHTSFLNSSEEKSNSRKSKPKTKSAVVQKTHSPLAESKKTPSPLPPFPKSEVITNSRFDRNGVFRPIGKGRRVQAFVLKAMQFWIWDEWVRLGDDFRMAVDPEGKVWTYDPFNRWLEEPEAHKELPLVKMVDLSHSDLMPSISLEELNEYGMNLFASLSPDSPDLDAGASQSVAIVCGYDLEQLAWRDLGIEIEELDEIPTNDP